MWEFGGNAANSYIFYTILFHFLVMYTSTCLLVLCTVFFSCSDSNNFRQEPDTTIPVEEDKTNPSLIVNGDMEDDISMDLSTIAVSGVWSYIGGWNAKAAIVEQKENSGVNNSRCLAIIALDEVTDVMFAQKVTGLKSGGYYKASAKVKTDMIAVSYTHLRAHET